MNIEQVFIKKNNTYRLCSQQTPALIFGLFSILISVLFLPNAPIWYYAITDPIGIIGNFCNTAFFLCFVFVGSLFILIGITRTISIIDFSTRTIRLELHNLRGKNIDIVPLDDIRITAQRMGITDINPDDIWFVSVGFLYNLNSDSKRVASYYEAQIRVPIFTKECTPSNCHRTMIQLYNFFFPEQNNISEHNIISNSSQKIILSPEEKEIYLKQVTESNRNKEILEN